MRPFTRAIEQLDDPAIWKILIGSLALSALGFALLCFGGFYGLHHWLSGNGMWGWIAGIAGGLTALLAAMWLFLPMAVVIASLFLEPVCRAVERRWYPNLTSPFGASFAAQNWDGLVIALRVLLLSIVSMILALIIPGLGLILGYAITAWALGRGLFVAVAMRRMTREDATALYARHRAAILLQGAALAFIGSVPLLNLLVPVVGTAAMLHVLELHGHQAETWG